MVNNFDFVCRSCAERWVGASPRCPRCGIDAGKPDGEVTNKSLQGTGDLKKGMR